MTTHDYDIVLIGAGAVGLSLIAAIADLPLKIAIIENRDLNALFSMHSNVDNRVFALSRASRDILQQLNIWNELIPQAIPLTTIHTSQEGGFATTKLQAHECGVDALGYTISAHELHYQLYLKLQHHSHITWLSSTNIQHFNYSQPLSKIKYTINNHENELRTKLVVLADGGRSSITKQLHLQQYDYDYQQTAIVAHLTLADEQHIAFERFTTQGPIGLLPTVNRQYVLIWAIKNHLLPEIQNTTSNEFIHLIKRQFGTRLGKIIACSDRQYFPLHLHYVPEQIKPGFVVLGNAAHSLHPVAAQGFNLSLRDVMGLASEIHNASHQQRSPGHMDYLHAYLQKRTRDQRQTLLFSHGLVQLFNTHQPPLILLRGMGMGLLEMASGLKRRFARRQMGYIF